MARSAGRCGAGWHGKELPLERGERQPQQRGPQAQLGVMLLLLPAPVAGVAPLCRGRIPARGLDLGEAHGRPGLGLGLGRSGHGAIAGKPCGLPLLLLAPLLPPPSPELLLPLPPTTPAATATAARRCC